MTEFFSSEQLEILFSFAQEMGMESSSFQVLQQKEPSGVDPKKGSTSIPTTKSSNLTPPLALEHTALSYLSASHLNFNQEQTTKAAACAGSDAIQSLRALYQGFQHCKACTLGQHRQHFVFGEGHHAAKVMFVGEGPGHEEDQSGRPFVGAAGQLLDKIITAMGLERKDVFIANVVKCRPPQNRTPTQLEIETCAPLLIRQIELVSPQIIVCLGKTPLYFFSGSPKSIVRARGTFFDFRGIPVMPTYHPAYLLRNAKAKHEVWQDVQKVMERLKGL
jgi:DNA polymerase